MHLAGKLKKYLGIGIIGQLIVALTATIMVIFNNITSFVIAFKGWTVDLDLVPTTFGYPVMVKYGSPDQNAFIPTPTPTPSPFLISGNGNALNHILSGFTSHLPSFSMPSLNSQTSTISPQWSFGMPKFMGMNLFSPMGFMSLMGFVVSIMLPLWIVCGLTFKGSIWYFRNRNKK